MALTLYYQHAIDALKGWSLATNLDFAAALSASTPASRLPVTAGTVVHLDNTGAFQLGAAAEQMPIFTIQGSDSLDVSNAAPVVNGSPAWVAQLPAGIMSGYVATGGYELASSEFDPTATFAPGDKLHAPTVAEITSGTDYTRAGLLHKAKTWPGGSGGIVVHVDNICGIVSRGVFPDMNNVSRLGFWCTYAPGNSTISAT